MGSTPGVFRATYKSKTGELREASTWVASYWCPVRGRTVKDYGFPSAGDAKTHRLQKMAEAATVVGPVRAATLTLREMLNLVIVDYEARKLKSVKTQRERADILCKGLGGDRRVRDLDEEAIHKYARERIAEGLSPSTANRYLALLKRAYRLASRRVHGLRIPHLVIRDESSAVRQGFFEKDVLKRILKHMAPWAAHVVQALHITGWRRSEIFNAQWSDIEDGFLLIRPGGSKNNRPRAFPLKPDLEPLIKLRRKETDRIERVTGEDCPWIFSFNGGRIYDIKSQWLRAYELSGVKTKHLVHDFRRTAVRDLIRAGVERDTAKKMTGHLTDSVFSRYNITDRADLSAAAKALSEYRFGKPKKKGDSERTRNVA